MDYENNIHEAIKPISWLAGRWVTEHGRGSFPNLKEFEYHEELEFLCVGQPMFNYISMSRDPETGTPMHQERGFLRINRGTNQLAFIDTITFKLQNIEVQFEDYVTCCDEGLATTGTLTDAEIIDTVNQNIDDDDVNENDVDHTDPASFEPPITNKEAGAAINTLR